MVRKLKYCLIFIFKLMFVLAQPKQTAIPLKDSVHIHGSYASVCVYNAVDTTFYPGTRNPENVSYYNNSFRLRDKGFYKDGRLRFVDEYDEQRYEHGIHAGWYDNGQLKFFSVSIHGEAHDSCMAWYESGEKDYEGLFNYGAGKIISYYKSGKIKQETINENRVKVSSRKRWCENGLLTEFHPNKDIFENIVYFCNGKVAVKGLSYLGTIYFGSFEWNYENGNPRARGSYIDINRKQKAINEIRNIEVGTWKYYYDNGKKERIENYDKDGNKEGTWKYYNKKGKLIKREIYKADKLIKTLDSKGGFG